MQRRVQPDWTGLDLCVSLVCAAVLSELGLANNGRDMGNNATSRQSAQLDQLPSSKHHGGSAICCFDAAVSLTWAVGWDVLGWDGMGCVALCCDDGC